MLTALSLAGFLLFFCSAPSLLSLVRPGLYVFWKSSVMLHCGHGHHYCCFRYFSSPWCLQEESPELLTANCRELSLCPALCLGRVTQWSQSSICVSGRVVQLYCPVVTVLSSVCLTMWPSRATQWSQSSALCVWPCSQAMQHSGHSHQLESLIIGTRSLPLMLPALLWVDGLVITFSVTLFPHSQNGNNVLISEGCWED